MKRIIVIAVLALAACNGSGTTAPAANDTVQSKIGIDTSMGNNLPENGSQTRTDTMKSGGVKPDSTMRQ